MNKYMVDRVKWSNMTIFEQMGNIYSEVGRSFVAKKRGDAVGAEAAVVRALDLFDATTELMVAQKSPRTKEVLRAKDQYLSVLYGDNASQEAGIDKYFMQFAIAARINS
jgi:hypothetical protein